MTNNWCSTNSSKQRCPERERVLGKAAATPQVAAQLPILTVRTLTTSVCLSWQRGCVSYCSLGNKVHPSVLATSVLSHFYTLLLNSSLKKVNSSLPTVNLETTNVKEEKQAGAKPHLLQHNTSPPPHTHISSYSFSPGFPSAPSEKLCNTSSP